MPVIIATLAEDFIKVDVVVVVETVVREVASDRILFVEVRWDGAHVCKPGPIKSPRVGVRGGLTEVRADLFYATLSWASQQPGSRDYREEPHAEHKPGHEMKAEQYRAKYLGDTYIIFNLKSFNV